MTLRLTVPLLIAVVSAAPIVARNRLTLAAGPAVAMAPANVVVRLTIDADADNRAVEVVVDSPGFYRSSEIPLEGDRAPQKTIVEFRSLPAGVYDVGATLLGPGGDKRAFAHQEVRIMGVGRDGPADR